MAITYTAASNGQAAGVSATIVSSAFSSAIGDFITVVCVGADSVTIPPALVTNNNTAVTWTRHVLQNVTENCAIALYSGTVVSGTPPTTVSAIFTGGTSTGSKWIAVKVHTGTHASTPLPAGKITSGSGTTDESEAITPTSSGSALWFAAGDWNQTNSFVAIANCTLGTPYNEAGQMTAVFVRPTTQPRTDANAFTIGETDTSGKMAWVAYEVQAAAAAGRTTKNTRSYTHGVNVGMGHRMPV